MKKDRRPYRTAVLFLPAVSALTGIRQAAGISRGRQGAENMSHTLDQAFRQFTGGQDYAFLACRR